MYGDSKGNVTMLLCGTREWPARDLICTDEHQDYIFIHQEHEDWVSRVGEAGGGDCDSGCNVRMVAVASG